MVPPSAVSNRPALWSLAPVNAPRTWPKSSLSKSVSTTAEQFTVTKRFVLRGPSLCSARATSSLPVPVSPVISAVRACGARRRIRSNSSCMAGAAANHSAEFQALGQLALELQYRAARGRLVANAGQQLAKALQVEWLGEEIHGAELRPPRRR